VTSGADDGLHDKMQAFTKVYGVNSLSHERGISGKFTP